MSRREIIAALVLTPLLLLVLWLVFSAVPAYFESATYNRLTGAHTTTWDALWVELRVQEGTKDATP